MGVMIEEIAKQMEEDEHVRDSLAVLVVDTMGIYWGMKHPNQYPAEREMLQEFGLFPGSFGEKLHVLIPHGFKEVFDEQDLEYDDVLRIRPGELEVEDWLAAYEIDQNSPTGILISRVINTLRERYRLGNFGFNEINRELDKIEKVRSPDTFTHKNVLQAARNRFMAAEDWGIFEKEGTGIYDIIRPGRITVLDVSGYRQYIGQWGVRSLIVGFLAKKIYRERTLWRRIEENKIARGESPLAVGGFPKVWMFIDEAHQFAPRAGNPPSLSPLREWIRQGRNPGLSLVMATQQPGGLVKDAISQCDIIICHRLTAKADRAELSEITPSYMKDIPSAADTFGKEVGTALVIDDNSEEVFVIKIRPRKSHHAGREAFLIGA